MGFTNPSRLRALAVVVTSVISGSLLIAVQPVAADTAPIVPSTPETVSTDALPTVQINGVVWDQVIVGNTVYAAGEFTSAQPAGAAAGVNTVPRSNLLAYNLTTGELIPSFAPTVNGRISSITVTPDHSRLFIGGIFTQVNGAARYRVAAFNPATGALINGFVPVVNSAVDIVEATNSTLYIGGNFSSVGGQPRVRAASVSTSNGAVTPFAPAAEGGRVRAIAISPDEQKIVLGGAFTTLNGSGNPGYGLGAVAASDGTLLPFAANTELIRNGGANAAVYSLTSDGDSVYGTGYHFGAGGTLEGTFRANWSDGAVVWVEDCHGDTYSAAVSGDVIYTASHAHYCGNSGGFPQTEPWTMQRGMAWSKASSGRLNTRDIYGYYSFDRTEAPELLNFWPDINVGTYTGSSQGAWNVVANENYVLYGGEFTIVNGKRQQGLVRFAKKAIAPNDDGPRLAGANFVPTAVSLAAGSVRLSWPANYDRDNQYLTYELYRNNVQTAPIYKKVQGSRIWFDRPTMGFIDSGLVPGQTYSYRLRATDPFGNTVLGSQVSVTASADGAASAYSNAILEDGASSFWRLGESSGATAYDWAGFDDAIVSSGVTRGAAGAIVSDPNTAASFSGDSTSVAASQSAVPGPDTFSVEAWFKTTSTSGGKIVGFGDRKTGNSSNYDRHVYMDTSGRVIFGVHPGQSRTIQSAPGLNDGQWHQVVATLGPNGMQLYMDGARVDARSDTTFGQAYSGYWRIGGDSSWAAADYFAGTIDEVAVYPQVLTGQQVNSHRMASGRPSALPTPPTDLYGATVFGDEPTLYWRLDEAAGTSASDVSGGGDSGILTGGVVPGAPGAIHGTTNSAASFDGVDGLVSTSRQYSNPQSYALELWFNSTTTSGGKLIGFGRSQTGESGSYDRHVYLQDDGRLVFGTYTGRTNTITTTQSLNDGAWHHVVANQSADGLSLFIDGEPAGTNPATGAEGYDGYWRVGGDNTWGSSSRYVKATIDEVAVYPAALSSAQVEDHFRTGTGFVANTAPVAAFAAQTDGMTATFDSSGSSDADGSVVGYVWSFGDGSPSVSGPSTSHRYASAGSYEVTLTVTDDDGASSSSTRNVTITAPNIGPVAAFTSDVNALSVVVDATGSADPDGMIATYAWNFGDGSVATGPRASRTYQAAGTYEIGLEVTDDAGVKSSTSSTVTVAPAPNQIPAASFTAASSGLTLSADASASTDSDGAITSWSWNFGDGRTGSGKIASHSFADAGEYEVTLTVTDDRAATASATRRVVVTAPPTDGPFAADGFGRVRTNGLGVADLGGTWTTSGNAANYAVNGGAATLRSAAAGATSTAYLQAATSLDSDVQVTASAQQQITGSGLYIQLVGRRVGSSEYRARAVIAANGTVTLQAQRDGTTLRAIAVPGLTYGTNDQLVMRVQVFGTSPTTVRTKVWRAGTTEPSGWLITATDTTAGLQQAGSVGLSTYLGGTATSVPVVVAFDDFSARSTTTAPPVTPPANTAPVAAFSSTSSDLAATLNGAQSSDTDGTIASYAWDFGDGSSGNGSTSSRTYANAGTYQVTLTVTDDRGATNSVSKPVTVSAPPVVTPDPAATVAADDFGRAVTAGLGVADTGGAWTTSGSSSAYGVASGRATFTSARAGATLSGYLTGMSETEVDLSVVTTVDKVPAGSALYVCVVGRRSGTNEYRARLVVNASGAVNLQLQNGGTTLRAITLAGLTFSPGDSIETRLQVVGTSPTTLRAKAWKAGSPEPVAWQVTATDGTAALQQAGHVGVSTYLPATATSVPLVVGFDRLRVIRPQ